MSTHRSILLALALVAAPLVACSDPTDILVVVQETNEPCTRDWCGPPCELAHRYQLEATRECSLQARIYVCSEVEICDAALDDLVGRVEVCSDDDDLVDLELCGE